MPPSSSSKVEATTTDSSSSSNNNIKVFLRVRPTSRPSPFLKLPHDEDDGCDLQDSGQKQVVSFEVPTDVASGYVNNTKTNYNFKFNGLLNMPATQEQVFDTIGKEAVMNALQGFNSTIFAYGQTGSGKTFTITGGPERYADRGIIPRAIAFLFSQFKKRADIQYQLYVSYLEVYNEVGYDLLDSSYEEAHNNNNNKAGGSAAAGGGGGGGVPSLPRVSMLEDEEGNAHLKNLSMHLVNSEEEALNYLFLGDTNRAISETAMNQASSRSHCIFCLSMEGRKPGSDRVLRSKLNLVDLAGSERVHKTAAEGQTLREAKFINQSLFYLEMVILALHEKRTHVPYRNSMMTSVLRDSLGGNCRTVMVATISAERANTDESISTCRFAQRVSMIKNDASINEEVDPHQVIRRLKQEVQVLRSEVTFLKGEAGEGGELSEQDRAYVERACQEYVDRRKKDGHGHGDEDEEEADIINLGGMALNRIYWGFRVMRSLVLRARAAAALDDGDDGGEGTNSALQADGSTSKTVRELQATLEQRENEIMILVNMIKQGKGGKGAASSSQLPAHARCALKQQQEEDAAAAASRHACTTTTKGGPLGLVVPKPPPESMGVLEDAGEAFSYFRCRHPRHGAMEENKGLLKDKYALAKHMGERVNQARSTINYLKKTIEQVRREKAIDGLRGGGGKEEDEGDDHDGDAGEGKEGEEEDKEEAQLKAAIEREKAVYQESFGKLRELKGEIEAIQRLLEKARTKMQAEFDDWYGKVLSSTTTTSQHHHHNNSSGHVGGGVAMVTTTGNKEADADIQAFYKARDDLLLMQQQQQQRGGGGMAAAAAAMEQQQREVVVGREGKEEEEEEGWRSGSRRK